MLFGAQSEIPVKYARRLLLFCVIVFRFNAKAQRREEFVNPGHHVFCVVVYPTDHYGKHLDFQTVLLFGARPFPTRRDWQVSEKFSRGLSNI
ncbi:MAG: hypothetical protein C5S49_03915 [Candidatus Methanogaster sp.]|nr:MAG: hypothetical protein C5S49_03915 [ANME-2 cluster archaeon]